MFRVAGAANFSHFRLWANYRTRSGSYPTPTLTSTLKHVFFTGADFFTGLKNLSNRLKDKQITINKSYL